jgi:hypothetical protein
MTHKNSAAQEKAVKPAVMPDGVQQHELLKKFCPEIFC